ncbi:hypothetical protein J6590_066447 [Homalodisca vitripennis]|nr:hypothetical protein J6590_066447 [Homalodisca vitripennis]
MLQVREIRENSGKKTGLEIREKSGNPVSSQGKVREFRRWSGKNIKSLYTNKLTAAAPSPSLQTTRRMKQAAKNPGDCVEKSQGKMKNLVWKSGKITICRCLGHGVPLSGVVTVPHWTRVFTLFKRVIGDFLRKFAKKAGPDLGRGGGGKMKGSVVDAWPRRRYNWTVDCSLSRVGHPPRNKRVDKVTIIIKRTSFGEFCSLALVYLREIVLCCTMRHMISDRIKSLLLSSGLVSANSALLLLCIYVRLFYVVL